MTDFRVNGQKRTFDGDPSMPLLWYLRDELGMTGTKFGCGVGCAARAPSMSTARRCAPAASRCRTSPASPSSPSRGSIRRASIRCRSRGAISACRNVAIARPARS